MLTTLLKTMNFFAPYKTYRINKSDAKLCLNLYKLNCQFYETL